MISLVVPTAEAAGNPLFLVCAEPDGVLLCGSVW
jgi:hypothetical protein